MASLKLPLYVDSSWESKKLNCTVKPLIFTDSKCCVPSFLGGGAFVVSPFCNLKHIRVSRLETEELETSELSIDNEGVDGFEGELGNESFVTERPNLGRDSKKGKFNVWRRFRRVKKVPKDSNYRSSFRLKDRKYGTEENPRIVFDVNSDENVIDSQNGVDFHDENIGSDSSLDQCNAILKELERGDDGKALSFFRWMRKNGKLKQNVTAYNLILRVLGRRGDWDGAEGMIKEMSMESGCKLTYQVFNTLIYACHKKGLVELGAKWFHMMLENGVQPNIATFGLLMALYQKGWHVEEAEFAFSMMRNLKIMCQSAYSSMLTIYTRMRLYDKAEEIIGFLRKDEVILNLENWLVLLNAYCQQGKLLEAEQVLASMNQAGFSPNIVAYNTLITGYGKISNMRDAQRLFGDIKRVGMEPDETTYRSMIEGWGRADNYEEANRYYAELKRLGHKPNSSNLYTMLNLQVKHGDEEDVVRTIEEMMHTGGEKSTILGILLQAYEKLELIHEVPSILRGSLYDHVLRNQISCSSLVMVYVKNSMIDDALKVLQEKQWKDALFEDNLYHLLICSCKDFGHPENAVKVFTCMPKSDKPNLHIICTMIDIYSTNNDFAEAEKLYLMLKNSDVKLDTITFSVVVRMYMKSGALEEACSVLDDMDRQKNIVPDTYLLRDMFRIYQRCDKKDKLADLYYKLVKRGVIWDQEMYSCVINCCARALPVDELSRLFDEMLKRGTCAPLNSENFQLLIFSLKMPINQITIGSHEELRHPGALKAALAEFISTLIFVFAGQGSGMAFNKLTDGVATPAGLISASIAHAFGLFVAVSVGANISGGHVNPAVTFGAFVGGNITLFRGILYIIAQLLGSTAACALLEFATGGMSTGSFALSAGVSVWNAFVFEIVMTFGLVYTVYATAVDPKKGDLGVIAPIAIGFIVGANILAGGAFTGASMNPAVSFGPSLVSWTWTHQWVYWAGPLIGGGLAGFIYEFIFISHTHEQIPSGDF